MNDTMNWRIYVDGNPVYITARTKTQALNWAKSHYRGICQINLVYWKKLAKRQALSQ